MIHQIVRATILFAALGLTKADDGPVFFRSGFNGAVEGTLDGKAIDPTIARGVGFVSLDDSESLKVDTGVFVHYDLGDTFPGEAGALELRFRPDFPQTTKSPARDVLRLKGEGDCEAVLSFNPSGLRWILAVSGNGWRKELTLWHGRVKAEQWSHLLFVWNKPAQSFSIYHDGKWVETIPSDKGFGGPAQFETGGAHDSGISIDEVALYKRAFTHSQAQVLAESFNRNGGRIPMIIERLARDDQALAERRVLLSKLAGKVGRVYPNRGVDPTQGIYPEGVIGVGIRPEDIGKIDLSQFSVIHFPQGPRFQIEPDQYQHLVDYVRNGGGYVGCCQGAFFAGELGLVDIKCYPMNVWGLYNIALSKEPHFVKGGREGTVRMHFGNGPVMVAGESCEVLGTYALGFPSGKPAAILTGELGKGNVVLFGTHPLGEKVSYKGTRAYFSGSLMETDTMFINSLLYAAGLVDREGAALEPN